MNDIVRKPLGGGLDARPRVGIADDHQLLRMGLRQLLEASGAFLVVGEAETRAELDGMLDQRDPDLLILDLQLKDGSVLEHLPVVMQKYPHLRVLVLSMHDQRVYAERCLRLGACGYLMKDEAAGQVVQALRTLAAGGTYLSPSLGDGRRNGPPIERLSDRELQVFELIGDGLPVRAIATRLCVSEKTVEAHKANIKRKLDLDHGTELTRLAMAWRETGGAARS